MADPLQIVGTISNFAARPSADADIAAHEAEGAFVCGDPAAIAAWSGLERRDRWKVRVLGPLAEMPMLWNHVRAFVYEGDRARAERHYEELRRTVLESIQGCQLRPHPAFPGGSAPGGRVELIVAPDGGNAGVLLLDREHDYDYAAAMTPGIGALESGNNGGPRVVGWQPPSCTALVSVARGASGAVDHVVLAFAPGSGDHRRLVSAGLPGAKRAKGTAEVVIEVPSGVLVAQWSRVVGRATLGPFGGDPGAGLARRMGQQVAAPLEAPDGDLGQRLPGPVAWAFRVTPGRWRAQLWAMDANAGGGLAALVLSRDGAGSFQLLQAGGAAGRTIAGLTLERYAALCFERDTLLAKASQGAGGGVGAALVGAAGGGPAKELAALAARYGLPTNGPAMTVARVPEWELAIQGDAGLTSEYAAFYGVARARMLGQDVDIDAVRAQAQATHEAVSRHASAHATATQKTYEGHFLVFEAARTGSAAELIEFARETAYAHLRPDELAWAMGRAFNALCLHDEDPIRVQDPMAVCPSFLAALWEVTPAEEREGALPRFVKRSTAEVAEAYGLRR
jgi:hypothetical protein